MPIDPRIDELVAKERLEEAGALAETLGDFALASTLFERAVKYEKAAKSALIGGDPARALQLFARGGDDEGAGIAAAALDADARAEAARDLEMRRLHRPAAIVHDLCGDPRASARCWELAGEAVLAADRLVAASESRGAARVLAGHVRAHPEDAEAAIALAKILLTHRRYEAAAATLQRVSTASPYALEARTLLARALEALGLSEAKNSLGELTSPPAEEAAGDHALVFGRYEIIRTVATTPTARVMEALDRVTNRPVAIKLLRAGSGGVEGLDAIARFERESRALERLHHPHVVPLYAYVPEGPAVVLAWMGGGSLADVLEKGSLKPAAAVEVATALLSALEEAHQMGFLHRDVKPSNVLFDESGAAHLADFGAAHVGEAAATVTLGLIGSLAYMAPEQRAGHAASVASDLYGVGAMLYESMTGARPAAADEITILPSAIYPELDGEHDRIVLALLARDPSTRPESAFSARKSLQSRTWRVSTDAPARTSKRPSLPSPSGERLRNLATGASWDALIERNVRVVAATPFTLALARAFARVDHEALVAIYRIDDRAASIWVEAPRAPSLAKSGAKLSAHARDELRRALSLIHAEGCAHGSIDASHVHESDDETQLAFPETSSPNASPEADFAALARL